MTNNIIESVFRFNRDVVKIGDRLMHPLTPDESRWLKSAIQEEGEELLGAFYSLTVENPTLKDVLVDQIDACVDAAIFAIGGLARMGLTEQQAEACFLAVMAANFEKKAGVKPGRQGAPDAVKPEGWIGPEARIRSILDV